MTNPIREAIKNFDQGVVAWGQHSLAYRPHDTFKDTNRIVRNFGMDAMVTTTPTDPTATMCCGLGGVCRIVGKTSTTAIEHEIREALDLAAEATDFDRDWSNCERVEAGDLFAYFNDTAADWPEVRDVMDAAAAILDARLEREAA